MTIAVALTLQLLALAVAVAQAPSKWCEYVSRSPKDILAHAHLGDSADVTMSGGQFPSRVTLRYTGNTRSLSADRQRFLHDYFNRVLAMPGTDTLFRHEVEFAQPSDSSLWLPIQETMLRDLQAEVRRSETSIVFLLWAGSYRRAFYEPGAMAAGASQDYLFLVNEFTSAKTRDNWSSVLATCN